MAERPLHGFHYYETDQGLLVKRIGNFSGEYQISGVKPQATFHSDWFLIPGVLKFTDYKAHAGFDYLNKRYELEDDSIETLPKVIPYDEVEKNDYNGDWIGKYKGLQGQYKYKTDTIDLGFSAQDVVTHYQGQFYLKNLKDPTKFRYTMEGEGYNPDKNRVELTLKDLWNNYDWHRYITVGDITRAMVPEFAWHLHPVSLTSQATYRIIRAFIKDNIKSAVAEITSDYDFCFTVKKRIAIKPYEYKYEVPRGSRSRRRPHFSSKTVTYRSEQIFEMTHEGQKYSGYTIIQPFLGESLEDLSKNIDAYLAELISVINTPIQECHHCNGIGAIDIEKVPTNERDFNNKKGL